MKQVHTKKLRSPKKRPAPTTLNQVEDVWLELIADDIVKKVPEITELIVELDYLVTDWRGNKLSLTLTINGRQMGTFVFIHQILTQMSLYGQVKKLFNRLVKERCLNIKRTLI